MVIGFEALESSLLAAYQRGKLHHAILIYGKEGIGKASFAKFFCKKILGGEAQYHPDLEIIEKEVGKKEIGVEKIRKISHFTNQTSAISESKFIIIDSACELNKSSSNALLKLLEEPHPNTFLILIAHKLGKVIPTIRSRCQIIKAFDPTKLQFQQILRDNKISFFGDDLKFIIEFCENSPALAISYGEDAKRFYQLFLRSIINKKINNELLKKVSEKDFSYQIVEKIIALFFSRLLKHLSRVEVDFFYEEKEIFMNLSRKLSSKKIFAMAEESLSAATLATPQHLDKKLNLINIFNRICYHDIF